MDDRDKLSKELEKELMDALFEAYPESIDVHELAMTHFRPDGVEPIWDSGTIQYEHAYRNKYQTKLGNLKKQGDVLYDETEWGYFNGKGSFNENPNVNESPFHDNMPLNVRMTSKRYEELKPNPIPIDKSMHFHEKAEGNFNTGDNANQTYNENAKSDKPKWFTWTYWRDKLIDLGIKSGMQQIIAGGILISLLGWLGFHFSKDKTKDTDKEQQKENPLPVQADSTKKKDSVPL